MNNIAPGAIETPLNATPLNGREKLEARGRLDSG